MLPEDCADAVVGLESIERMKYVRLSDGSFAKRIVVATGGSDVDCDTMDTLKTYRMGASVKVGTDQWADQVIDVS